MTSSGRELLKWIALVFMTFDHVVKALLDGYVPVLSELGRIAFPVFALIMAFNLAQPSNRLREVGKAVGWLGAHCTAVPRVGIWFPAAGQHPYHLRTCDLSRLVNARSPLAAGLVSWTACANGRRLSMDRSLACRGGMELVSHWRNAAVTCRPGFHKTDFSQIAVDVVDLHGTVVLEQRQWLGLVGTSADAARQAAVTATPAALGILWLLRCTLGRDRPHLDSKLVASCAADAVRIDSLGSRCPEPWARGFCVRAAVAQRRLSITALITWQLAASGHVSPRAQ